MECVVKETVIERWTPDRQSLCGPLLSHVGQGRY